VYAPKLKHADDKHAPPPLGKGILAWFTPLMKMRETDLVDKIGLDATIFLRFTRMCRNLFVVMTVFGCAIMIPANVMSGTKAVQNGANDLIKITPEFVFGQGLWAHVACSWLFDGIIAFFLWHNYRAVAKLRRRYFESKEYQASLHARTLMV
jgi:hypothetical protein